MAVFNSYFQTQLIGYFMQVYNYVQTHTEVKA